MSYVVLCRGDEHDADIEVFGPFDTFKKGEDWIECEERNCPNLHEVTDLVRA